MFTMEQLAPILGELWVVLKFVTPYVLGIGVFLWAMNWVDSKVRRLNSKKAAPKSASTARRSVAGRRAREKGLAFEQELIRLFREAGWHVEETALSGDRGVDLIVKYHNRRYAIQAKHRRDQVGPSAVREVFTGNAIYGCDGAILIATGGVTNQAQAEADQVGVLVWGESDIAKLKKAAPGAQLGN